MAAVLGVVLLFASLAFLISWVDGLTLLGPRSTTALRASAELFCTETCRVDGRCPLSEGGEPSERCPLRRYVALDVPTQIRGRPSEMPFEPFVT